jgi:hypothetical protein
MYLPLLFEDFMALYDEVYGLKYKSALEQTNLLLAEMKQQAGVGFEDVQTLKDWAHKHRLDKVLFSNMSHQFMCVSHKGEIMLPTAFENYYKDILFYEERIGSKVSRMTWHPEGFEYYDVAYIASEQTDGVHRPLYYRDYTVPTGFYNEERDAFNVAKPFPVFAKETGADTSHIYTYIEHIAGECAYHLLAWLRAKLLYPTTKTQVVPIIVSRAQGSGKTTFAEVICKGLFGKDNVIVSDQYDSTARFNADYADALIVCQEEKEETDKRNPAGALKSRATATTIRKEQKGIDPIYQESYTDFIMTTNKDVPIKFDGREDQRRFMIMEADPAFTRKTSELADEVFTKLYGYDANFNRVGKPFVEDKELIAQFKHELFTRADIAAVELRNFPKTAAYKRCFTLPRTSEATEIESILRALAPFIKASLEQKQLVTEIEGVGSLSDFVQYVGAIQYMPSFKEHSAFIALCRPLVFYEMQTMKPFNHSTVERGIYDCGPWLISDFGITILGDMEPLIGGFTNIAGRYRTAPAAKFCLVSDIHNNPVGHIQNVQRPSIQNKPAQRIGERFRVNKYFAPDSNGCFETVNELKPEVHDIKGDKTSKVQYMDTFLLESDTPTHSQEIQEKTRAQEYIDLNGDGAEISANVLYKERLHYAKLESERLFNEGIVARIVYSGAKSYHLLVRVADAPTTLEEYRWLHAYLCATVSNKLEFDASTSDPARLTRSPITLSRVTSAYGLLVSGEQHLVAEDWTHVYTLNWRELYNSWLNRPLKKYEQHFGKPLYPTRKEYLDAVEALIDGSFWTNDAFDGERQRLFFPAYRLLRVLGYSRDDAWNTVLLPGMSKYKKHSEINYWKTRQQSSLIKKIDAEIDDYDDKNMEGSND